MKKAYLVSLLLAFVFSQVQSKDLSGNWKEVKRTRISGADVRYNDTMLLAFLTGNEYTFQKQGSVVYRGTYKFQNNTLDIGAKIFTVLKHTNKKLVLKDNHGIYEFEPYVPAPQAMIAAEKKPDPVNHIERIAGKWNVFKRTSETTMKDIDYKNLVEDVVIEKRPDGSWGAITSSASPHEKDGWKITGLSNGYLYAEGVTKRRFEVSVRGKELILKEENITYFLKQFKE